LERIISDSSFLELANRAGRIMDQALAPTTRTRYLASWRRYEAWCAAKGIQKPNSDPKTITLFLTERSAKVGQSALEQDLAAIRFMCAMNGVEFKDPRNYLRRFMRGIRRERGHDPKRKRMIAPVLLGQMLDHLPENGPKASRDRAALLIGFSLALRRSEIVAIGWDDIVFEDAHLIVRLKPSKNQSNAVFQWIPKVPSSLCAFNAMQHWYQLSNRPIDGPCFPAIRDGKIQKRAVSDRYINRLVKRLLLLCDKVPQEFGAHSLRSGIATAAHWEGLSDADIRKITRHKSTGGLLPYLQPKDGLLHEQIFRSFDNEG
jgi:integrase